MIKYCNKSTVQPNKYFTVSLMIYFLMLPFGAMSLGSFGSLLKYIAILPIMIFLMQYRRLVLSKIIIIQILIIYSYVISLIYSVDFRASCQKIKTEILFCVLLIITGCANFKASELIQIKKGLVGSSRITCVILLLFGSLEENRLFLSGTLTEDPNYLNGYLLFGIVNAIQNILSDTKKRNHFFFIIETFFYLYASLLTGSRGGLISIIIAVTSITVFVIYEKKNSREKKLILSIIMIILIIYIILGLMPVELVNRFYWDSIITSKGTGRFVIWEESLRIFSESNIFIKLFGSGAGSILTVFENHGFRRVVAHNVFIQHLLEGGLLSLLLYIIFIYLCLLKSYKKKEWFILSCLIGFITLSFSTSIVAYKPYWNAILFTNLISNKKI